MGISVHVPLRVLLPCLSPGVVALILHELALLRPLAHGTLPLSAAIDAIGAAFIEAAQGEDNLPVPPGSPVLIPHPHIGIAIHT